MNDDLEQFAAKGMAAQAAINPKGTEMDTPRILSELTDEQISHIRIVSLQAAAGSMAATQDRDAETVLPLADRMATWVITGQDRLNMTDQLRQAVVDAAREWTFATFGNEPAIIEGDEDNFGRHELALARAVIEFVRPVAASSDTPGEDQDHG